MNGGEFKGRRSERGVELRGEFRDLAGRRRAAGEFGRGASRDEGLAERDTVAEAGQKQEIPWLDPSAAITSSSEPRGGTRLRSTRTGVFALRAASMMVCVAQTSITEGWQGASTRSLSRMALSSRFEAAPGQSTSTMSWLRAAALMSELAR